MSAIQAHRRGEASDGVALAIVALEDRLDGFSVLPFGADDPEHCQAGWRGGDRPLVQPAAYHGTDLREPCSGKRLAVSRSGAGPSLRVREKDAL